MRGIEGGEWEWSLGGVVAEVVAEAAYVLHGDDAVAARHSFPADDAGAAVRSPTRAICGNGSRAESPCIDLRQLAAPAPMELALATVDELAPGAEVVLLTPRMPTPLLQLLEARGFAVDARPLADGTACVRVRAPSD